MYAGMSGSTHGEIKLTKPAKNESVKEIIIILVGAFCYPNLFKLISVNKSFLNISLKNFIETLDFFEKHYD